MTTGNTMTDDRKALIEKLTALMRERQKDYNLPDEIRILNDAITALSAEPSPDAAQGVGTIGHVSGGHASLAGAVLHGAGPGGECGEVPPNDLIDKASLYVKNNGLDRDTFTTVCAVVWGAAIAWDRQRAASAASAGKPVIEFRGKRHNSDTEIWGYLLDPKVIPDIGARLYAHPPADAVSSVQDEGVVVIDAAEREAILAGINALNNAVTITSVEADKHIAALSRLASK